jgi:hypothetical protein
VASIRSISATLSLPLLLDAVLGHPTVPPSHSTHTADPAAPLYVPTSQGMQTAADVARTAVLKRPATQLVQPMAPPSAEY